MSAPDPAPASASFLSLPQAEARQRLLQVLAGLEPLQRQIVGRRLCGLTDLDQIAAAVGCEPDAARLMLVQGIARLRAELSEAPQDKNNNDWLKRCQALLMPPARRARPAPDTDETQTSTEAVPAAAHRPGDQAGLEAEAETSTEAEIEAEAEAGIETETGIEAGSGIEADEIETGIEAQPASEPESTPKAQAPARPLGPRLLWPVALALVAGIAVWAGQHYASKPPPPPPEPFDPEIAATAEPVPEAAPNGAPEPQGELAPLTAADLELVLLQQQHPGLLENLDFFLWLVEKDALR